MFLNENDYKTVIDKRSLDVLQQSDEESRAKAERMAIEEVSGYLRYRYDVDAIFAALDDARNPMIVMITMDVALYHLVSWLPQKMGAEVREKRYERAVEWLSGVQSGKIAPSLPLLTNSETGETDTGNPMRWGSATKNAYDY